MGMTWAFMEVHEAIARGQGDMALLCEESRCVLQEIVIRERTGLDICKEEIFQDQKRKQEFCTGLYIARRAIQACFTK